MSEEERGRDLLQVTMREARRALVIKDAGNSHFCSGDWARAHECYTRALCMLPPAFSAWLAFSATAPTCQDDVGEVRAVLLSNRAAACLGNGWLLPAVLDASSAIAECHARRVPLSKQVAQKQQGSGGAGSAGASSAPTALGQLLAKSHTRRARAYERLGYLRRAERDHRLAQRVRAGRRPRLKATPKPKAAAAVAAAAEGAPTAMAAADGGDDGGDDGAAAVAAVLVWNVRQDWAALIEAQLGAADLGRLRRVNR
jgi:tetratricopeptide (TPR) repeat protein